MSKIWVKCTAADHLGLLELGKVYQVEVDNGSAYNYWIYSEREDTAFLWDKRRFDVLGCPCGIQGCLTHRKSK